jgi:hypothetical protein
MEKDQMKKWFLRRDLPVPRCGLGWVMPMAGAALAVAYGKHLCHMI